MGNITYPRQVKLFIGLIYEKKEIQHNAIEQLLELYNAIDFESSELLFDFTDYYREIGSGLKRRFFSFERLINCDELPDIKIETNRIEDRLRDKKDKRRLINIDPGYLASEKVVLATTKNYTHRPYLCKGIYAELTYIYKKAAYQTLEWTYPDYKTDEYIEVFTHIRKIYMNSIRVQVPENLT